MALKHEYSITYQPNPFATTAQTTIDMIRKATNTAFLNDHEKQKFETALQRVGIEAEKQNGRLNRNSGQQTVGINEDHKHYKDIEFLIEVNNRTQYVYNNPTHDASSPDFPNCSPDPFTAKNTNPNTNGLVQLPNSKELLLASTDNNPLDTAKTVTA